MKKNIKIKFVDFQKSERYMCDEFVALLNDKYNVEISDNPDYIFYSVFGYEHLKYNCIRIFYTAECYTPNFNECDYSIGFDYLSFGDRYLRVPLFKLFHYKFDYFKLKTRPVFTTEDLLHKDGFCSFVYSNYLAQDARAIFFDKLSEYKIVSSGGRYKNNIGGAVKDKQSFQSKHKFAIAFENTSYRGYCTEKIMEAFVAGCVPIYYGDPCAVADFNPKSFINVHDYESFDLAIEEIKAIDQDDEKYLAMRNSNPIENRDMKTHLEAFLFNIFDQEYEKAFRRPFSLHAQNREGAQLRHAFFELYIYKKFIMRFLNIIARIRKGAIFLKKRNK